MGKLGYILHQTDDRMLSWEGERCEMTADVAIDTYEDHRMAMAFAPACVVTVSYTHLSDSRSFQQSGNHLTGIIRNKLSRGQ